MVSSAAAVLQLLGQVIDLWQQIDRARESVKSAPKVFTDTKVQVSSLSEIVQKVKRNPNLRAPEIHDHLKRVDIITNELRDLLEAMATRQRKSSLQQGFHAFRRGTRDEEKLHNILKQLESAKTELALRINLVHMDMTGEIAEDMGRLAEGAKTTQAKNMVAEINHRLSLKDNESRDQAQQVNGILGMEESRVSTTAMIIENKALGNSQQRNLILGGSDLIRLLRF